MTFGVNLENAPGIEYPWSIRITGGVHVNLPDAAASLRRTCRVELAHNLLSPYTYVGEIVE